MATQRRFFGLLIGVLAILASGAIEPGSAETLYPPAAAVPSAVDLAAVTPVRDVPVRPELSGEQLIEQLGSGLRAWRPSDDVDGETVEGLDPVAEAFAESSRFAARVAVRVERPAYPVVVNSEVQYFLDRFTGSRRDVVNLWVSRSSRYLGMIREILRTRGLPEDLAYTAMIESGFNPTAVSRVGAKGMWQFMAPTARRYGLRVDRWVDERLDPEKSTRAAAAYLRDLYNIFGSWPLAQAAYNAGEAVVARAIRKTGSDDFWTLARTKHLRRETKDFVPQIQAATVIGRDPDRFGFDFDEEDPVVVETVSVPPKTDLRRVAAAAAIPFETLRAMNRVLVRGITPPGAPYALRVPAGAQEAVLTALAPKPVMRQTVASRQGGQVVRAAATGADVHVVRPRDTVSSIARQYGVSVGDLVRWNSLVSQDRIHPGDRLRIADAR